MKIKWLLLIIGIVIIGSVVGVGSFLYTTRTQVYAYVNDRISIANQMGINPQNIAAGTNYGWINCIIVMSDNTDFSWINGRPWVIFNASASPPNISNSASTYTLNSDNSGSGIVMPNTTYYANPLGSTTSPTTGGVLNTECEWTLTNTSTSAIDLTVTMTDYSGGGSNSTNSNSGSPDTPSNGATSYGACSYFSGQASTAWQIIKTSGSTTGYSNLSANTNIKWGMLELTQTSLATSAVASTSVITITATNH